MKNVLIAMTMFLGIIVLTQANVAAQGCDHKGKACCGKTTTTSTQSSTITGAVKDSLKVSGKCESCKARIEKAAKSVKGVKDALWNSATSMLVYSYDGTVLKADVSNAIIKVGHDTALGTAPETAYNKLPACCKYR
jgi:copper chaperone CopZ